MTASFVSVSVLRGISTPSFLPSCSCSCSTRSSRSARLRSTWALWVDNGFWCEARRRLNWDGKSPDSSLIPHSRSSLAEATLAYPVKWVSSLRPFSSCISIARRGVAWQNWYVAGHIMCDSINGTLTPYDINVLFLSKGGVAWVAWICSGTLCQNGYFYMSTNYIHFVYVFIHLFSTKFDVVAY